MRGLWDQVMEILVNGVFFLAIAAAIVLIFILVRYW